MEPRNPIPTSVRAWLSGRRGSRPGNTLAPLVLFLSFSVAPSPLRAQVTWADSVVREHVASMAAHHLCSGTFVVGRDYRRTPEQVLEEDIRPFPDFAWREDFQWEVDPTSRTAAVWAAGINRRVAAYNDDQGCTILPVGDRRVSYTSVPVPRSGPDPATTPWPTGDLEAHATFPEIDADELSAALDWAMAQPQNTRALVVVYGGKIVGERYAPGFTRHTPQISWSQGKSITAALVGILVQQGKLSLEDPAPVPEWQGEGDPRGAIRIRDLLHMSSGLDFLNQGLGRASSWLDANEHFRVYFDAIDVFEHAINQPTDLPPDSLFRYRNSDPLTLGRIVRQAVEADGGEYLTFPQRALFDRIGARDYILETDPWGNFIMTGYDFGSAWSWARFGLLHLWNGVWEGERILPEDWTKFVSTPAPGARRQEYGGLFWLNRNGDLDRIPTDAYWAAGFMGQTTMIIPSRDMVVVRLGPSPGGYNAYLNEVVGRVLGSFGG